MGRLPPPLIAFLALTAPANCDLLACQESLTELLDPSFFKALSVANDASSTMHRDAYDTLSSTTGYPGSVGDYGECGKVQLFDDLGHQVVDTHLCLAGSISLNATVGLPPFGGVCVPAQCKPEDLESAALYDWLAAKEQQLWSSVASRNEQIEYVHNLREVSMVCKDTWTGYTCGSYQKQRFGWDVLCVCGFMLLLVTFVIWATVLDLIRAPDYPEDADHHVAETAHGDEQAAEHISKYLAAFSVPRNLRRLFHIGPRNELGVFDGLKVISMLWVVLGHILAVQASVGYLDPEVTMPPTGIISKPEGQLFFSARFAVDTFFYLSGFLVVYVMLKRFDTNRQQMQRWPQWLPYFYLHRWLRIFPMYMFCMLFWWKVAPYMGEGPFWYRWEYFIGLCDQIWWSNVLFINNLVPWGRGETMECFYHTWYLANDMQFYIVSPIFIVLYLNRPRLGCLLVALVLLASTAGMVYGTFAGDWSALTLDGSWTIKYSQEAYTAPWFRIVPYLMGMSFAVFWHEKQQRAPGYSLSHRQRYIMLSTAVALLTLVTYVGYSGYSAFPCAPKDNPDQFVCGSGWNVWQRTLYNAGTRPVWCLGLSLLCFVCLNNQGGLIQQFLAHRAWVPLARLSFGAYLLHPLVINLWFLNSVDKFYFSKLDFAMIYIGVSTVTFGSAAVVSLLVESPMTKLGKYMEEYLRFAPARQVKSAGDGLTISARDQDEDGPEFEAAAQSPGFAVRHSPAISSESIREREHLLRREGECEWLALAHPWRKL
ncbi:unnamed protein product [Chrysoparadoxa australica]